MPAKSKNALSSAQPVSELRCIVNPQPLDVAEVGRLLTDPHHVIRELKACHQVGRCPPQVLRPQIAVVVCHRPLYPRQGKISTVGIHANLELIFVM